MSNNQIQYDIFLKGSNVDLIGLNDDVVSFSNWYAWFNDEETTQYMQKHYYPNSMSLQRKYLQEDIVGSSTHLQLGILHKKDQVVIGTISLGNIDYLNRKCDLAGLIGEKKYKNISLWMEANHILIAHAVNSLNVRRIYGGSISREVAVFYQRMLGFNLEGVLKQDVYKNGNYYDVHLFARIFDSQYEPSIEKV
jgi:RimJ/RimL family protein N-acetyltransferase